MLPAIASLLLIPLAAIDGIVRVAGTDRPAAGMLVHILDLGSAENTVVTDDEGRFRWEPKNFGSQGPAWEGREGPGCWVEPADPPWSREVVAAESEYGGKPDWTRHLEEFAHRAKSSWQQVDGRTLLIVESPPTGELEVLVRGPDGTPVADRAIDVFPHGGPMRFGDGVALRFRGRTDAEGRFRMRWLVGPRPLRIVVPGLGYGTIGTVEVAADRVARAGTPPLARFGRIEGTVEPAPGGPGTTVFAGHRAWDQVRAKCDAGGRFVLDDVMSGTIRPLARRNGQRLPTEQVTVAVPLGGLARVTLRPPTPRPQPEPVIRPIGPKPGEKEVEVVWVAGRVVDEARRPQPGAKVYARGDFHGGIRMYEDIREATADADGRYGVRGPLRNMVGPLAVVASTEGKPPAVAYAIPPSKPDEMRPTLDLTLADRGGDLRVAIIKDGRPVPGASVRLTSRSGAGLYSPVYVGAARGPGRAAITAAFEPTAQAGPDGVARFGNIYPGLYQVAASESPAPDALGRLGEMGGQPFPWRGQDPAAPAYALAEGLAVIARRELSYTLAVHPQSYLLKLRAVAPDGWSPLKQHLSFQFGRRETGASATFETDDKGVGRYDFGSPGLWAVDVRFRDAEVRWSPLSQEPFYRAAVVLPMSPALPLPDPVELKAERREPGSLRARLLDAEGHPARGTIAILGGSMGFDEAIDHAATVDDKGGVTFRDLPSGDYTLRGWIDGLEPPPNPQAPGPLPEDASLRGRLAVPTVLASVRADAETSVEVRAQPVGYVRGTIQLPEGRAPADYVIQPWIDWRSRLTQYRVDREAGRFLCGPLLPGKLVIEYQLRADGNTFRRAGTQEVEVPPGEVADIVLTPGAAEAGPATKDQGQVVLGMGGLSTREGVGGIPTGTVRRSDGESAAFAARGLLFQPEHDQPSASGVTDASGRLTWSGAWMSGESRGGGGRVARPTAVVWQPGETGAAVVELAPGRPFRATLPPPIAAGGRVTLGGRPADGRNARLLVVAAHRGLGVLDEALSVRASAGTDGRFTLRGLTPGRYRIQAARDGIWLSAGVDLVVERGDTPPEIDLDIAEPGEPLAVELVDERGRPVVGRDVTPIRPDGPLASLWPSSFRTDAAGRALILGLEAGPHAVRIDGETRPREVLIGAASGPVGRPRVARFELASP